MNINYANIKNVNEGFSAIEVMRENAIIEPPKDNEYSKKVYRYVIDSRDRNTNIWKTPSNYEIHLDEHMTDIQSMELLNIEVPFVKYLINKYNNKLYYNDKFIELDIGDYDGDSLANEISEKCRDDGIECKYNSDGKTNKFSFKSASLIIYKFKGFDVKIDSTDVRKTMLKSTLGRILGFEADDYEVSGGMEFFAPYKSNLLQDNYMILTIEKAKVNVSPSMSIHSSFAVINKNSDNLIKSNQSSEMNVKRFNPPIALLTKLRLKFKDYDGNLYDFQNHDHKLELQFTCFKQTRKYNDIFSKS